jgi:phosphatidylglycerol:prolipoprotein diacylglycerol transferase
LIATRTATPVFRDQRDGRFLTLAVRGATVSAMHPVLFTIPGIDLPIYSYGVMLGLSLVVGWYLVMALGGKDGLPRDKMANCFIWTALAAMIGSRVLYIATNLEEFQGSSFVDIVNLRKGGLVAYGGFLGGFLGSWLYLRRQRIRLLPWADVVVPTLASGLGITRIGCFLYGCDYGKPIPEEAAGWIKSIGLQFPNWQAKFPELSRQMAEGVGCMGGPFTGAPAFVHHQSIGLVVHGAEHSALVYPTQLMEILNGWVIFAVLMFLRKKRQFRGQLFLVFTAYYGVTRALMEILRGDTQRGGIGILSTSQIVGIVTFLAALAAWIYLSRRAKEDPEAAMALGPGAVPENAKGDSKKKRRKKRRK